MLCRPGFLAGYNTMDTIAWLRTTTACIFWGLEVWKKTGRVHRGVLLFVIYSMLAHIGLFRGAFPEPAEWSPGADQCGPQCFVGRVARSPPAAICCFNVCRSDGPCWGVFCRTVSELSYCARGVAGGSMARGLDQVPLFSVPVLNIIYPVL